MYDEIDFLDEFADVVGTVGGEAHDDGTPSSPGAAPSPTSSPAMNHQGSGTNTTPSSSSGPAASTPSDAEGERRSRTHRSSTDESHPAPKTPSQPAPVKPAPVKATKTVLTTPVKNNSSPASHSTPNTPSSVSSNHVATPPTPQVNGAAIR